MTDIRQSNAYAMYLKSEGWIVEKYEGIYYFIKKVPVLGSIIKVQRVEKIDFKAIKYLEKSYKAFLTILEPSVIKSKQNHDLLLHNGFKLSKSPYLPTKTLQLDLTQPIDKITAKLKKHTRQAIKKGERLIIKEHSTPKEIEKFYIAWKNIIYLNRSMPNLNDLLNLKKSFNKNDTIFLASHNIVSRIIGGALFTISRENDDMVCYYWKAFANNEGRSTLSPYRLLYLGILWAKKQGCTIFDFEGIYDERFPNRNWLGFSRFKKSFGGLPVLYPGCYTKFNLKNVFSFKA